MKNLVFQMKNIEFRSETLDFNQKTRYVKSEILQYLHERW